MYGHKDKYVLKKGKNIFAWDLIEKALSNYIIRKEYQIRLLKDKLTMAETYYQIAINLKKEQ